jgi:hypothetical protein
MAVAVPVGIVYSEAKSFQVTNVFRAGTLARQSLRPPPQGSEARKGARGQVSPRDQTIAARCFKKSPPELGIAEPFGV